ncbi:hypothetical protein ACFQ36_19775, partial [Arthrobacter sp. GCM10027362]|uniref:hypothetical protein n=1 Tax=Arthrobacter sp. GCM10027362 TaxID=3273379 RepID=UPI003635BA73
MSLRSVFAAVLGLVAVLLAAGALPAAWLQQNVFDEAGFVSFTEPMVEDPQFRSALSTAVARDVGRQLNAGPAIDALAKHVIEQVTGRLTELDGFERVWRETAARSHRLSLADPEHPDLAVQLAPLAGLVAREVADRLGAEAPAVADRAVHFGNAELNGYVAAAGRTAAAWPWLAAGAVVAAVGAVLLADRRAAAVIWLGVGTAAAGLLLWAAAGQLPALAG